MDNEQDGARFLEPAPGVRLRTVAHGQSTHMVEFQLKAGADVPRHSHPNEQIGYLVSGRLRLVIKGNEHVFEPGGSWCIPGDIVHEAQVLEDSVVIEVFSPPREDYL